MSDNIDPPTGSLAESAPPIGSSDQHPTDPSVESIDDQADSFPAREKHQGKGTRRLIDRFAGPIDALQIVTEADAEKANAALEQLIEGDEVETEILEELLDSRPLAEPEVFAVAHRTFIRALEVYHRNAQRTPSTLPFRRFSKPLILPLVVILTIAIANTYKKRVLRDVQRLYLLREANSPIGSHEHRVLGSARRQLDALVPSLTGGFSIPAFLLGGAVFSTFASLLQSMLHSSVGRFALLAVVLLVTIWTFVGLIAAASVARRRTHLVLDQPLNLLWQSIGSAGRPPREQSRAFVAVAAVLLLIGWIITPLTAAVLYNFI